LEERERVDDLSEILMRSEKEGLMKRFDPEWKRTIEYDDFFGRVVGKTVGC